MRDVLDSSPSRVVSLYGSCNSHTVCINESFRYISQLQNKYTTHSDTRRINPPCTCKDLWIDPPFGFDRHTFIHIGTN